MYARFYINLLNKAIKIKAYRFFGVPFQLPYKYTFNLKGNTNRE